MSYDYESFSSRPALERTASLVTFASASSFRDEGKLLGTLPLPRDPLYPWESARG